MRGRERRRKREEEDERKRVRSQVVAESQRKAVPKASKEVKQLENYSTHFMNECHLSGQMCERERERWRVGEAERV